MSAHRLAGDQPRRHRLVQDVPQSRDPRRIAWSFGRVGALLACAFSMVFAAEALAFESSHDTTFRLTRSQAPFGIRCETRHQRREVSWRNFVVDRVSECLPIPLAGDATESCVAATAASSSHASSHASSPSATPSPTTAAPLSAQDIAARRVEWSADRTRFGNVQHTRSLRAMDGWRSRAAR